MKFNETFATRTVNIRLLDADYGSVIRDAELTKDKATLMTAYVYKSKSTGFNMIHVHEGYLGIPRSIAIPVTGDIFPKSQKQFKPSYLRNNLFLYVAPGTKELKEFATRFGYDKPTQALESFSRILLRHTNFENLVMVEQDEDTRSVEGLKNYIVENSLENVYCVYYSGVVVFLFFDAPKTYSIAQALMGSYYHSR